MERLENIFFLDIKHSLKTGSKSSIAIRESWLGRVRWSLEFRWKHRVLARLEKQQTFHQVSQTMLDASAVLVYRRRKEVCSDRLLCLPGWFPWMLAAW